MRLDELMLEIFTQMDKLNGKTFEGARVREFDVVIFDGSDLYEVDNIKISDEDGFVKIYYKEKK